MRFAPLIASLSLFGCADEETAPASETPAAPLGCAEDEIALPDGSCIRPGIASDGCGEGFTHDGLFGCEPVLPPEPCPAGLMAVPGDAACRPVMSCGRGKWGDIPIDGTTLHVDGAYTGGGSDGSAPRPFTTIAAAYAAAAPGALIAIAPGSYAEDVAIIGKPVRLWGVCPERVEIVGIGQASTSCAAMGICIVDGADGTEVHGLAVRGMGRGVSVSSAMNVVLDRLWVHDMTGVGIDVESVLGPVSATLSGSLVEHNVEIGLFFIGTVQATVESTVVRATQPRPSDQRGGLGIDIEAGCPANFCDPSLRANVTVRGSVVERNHLVGIHVSSSDATIENTVVRDTLPQANDLVNGRGINAEPWCTSFPCDASTRARVEVRGSVVERSHDVGLAVAASDAEVQTTVVRDTAPRAFDQDSGGGVNVMGFCLGDLCESGARGSLVVDKVLIERNHDIGLAVMGSDASIIDTVVRETRPAPGAPRFGYGISVQLLCATVGVCDAATRSSALLQGSLVEHNHANGVFIGGSDGTLERVVVRDTAANSEGRFGDGLAVTTWPDPLAVSNAKVTSSRIERSTRAGIANFGATVTLSGTDIECAAFDLDGEYWGMVPFTFLDEGGNRCGCPTANGVCKLVTANLDPPEPLD